MTTGPVKFQPDQNKTLVCRVEYCTLQYNFMKSKYCFEEKKKEILQFCMTHKDLPSASSKGKYSFSIISVESGEIITTILSVLTHFL